jgi:hypothetical protein
VNASAAPTAISVMVGLFRSLDPVAVPTKASAFVPPRDRYCAVPSGKMVVRSIKAREAYCMQAHEDVERRCAPACFQNIHSCCNNMWPSSHINAQIKHQAPCDAVFYTTSSPLRTLYLFLVAHCDLAGGFDDRDKHDGTPERDHAHCKICLWTPLRQFDIA